MSTDARPTNLARLTLPALVAQWARLVDYLERHTVPATEFAADVDVRHEIAQRLRAKPTTLETREMLGEIDEHFRRITVEQAECLHGEARAAAAQWTPGREWYYWRGPATPGHG